MRIRTRRTFFEAAAAAAVTAAAGCGGANRSWRALSDREARTLDALLACIIPADDAPGAREAGVIHYIDRQLAGRFREHRPAYGAGLAAADQFAGGDFAGAAPERQQEAIGRLGTFFDLVVTHAMQGFYGNPRHGGNREFASWRMLRIAPVPVRGRDRRAQS